MNGALTPEVEIGAEAPTALYRFFAADGALLYVGITGDLPRRLTRHADTQDWWPNVSRKTVTWFQSRHHALLAEATAIRDEKPVCNLAVAMTFGNSRPARNPLGHEPSAVTLARLHEGLTKTELAERLGVALSLISQIESGKRNATPAMLNRLADALNCPRVVLERKRCSMSDHAAAGAA